MTNAIKVINPKTDGVVIEDFEPEDEEIGRRFVEAAGRKFKFITKDPYGLWNIAVDRGKLPKELEGQFTTQTDCERAVQKYINKKA